MSEDNLFYKVLRVADGNHLRSLWIDMEDFDFHPYHMIRPPEGWGPFCVFDSMFYAHTLIMTHFIPNPVMYSCRIIPSWGDSVWTPKTEKRSIVNFPPGTVLADGIQLETLVWSSKENAEWRGVDADYSGVWPRVQ